MKPSRTVLGFKNMTNTAISSELSTEVFSPQIVRIAMTLGCNPGGGVMTLHDYGYLPPELLKSYPVSE